MSKSQIVKDNAVQQVKGKFYENIQRGKTVHRI